MIEKITYIESNQFSPYRNLAVEEYLLLHCEIKNVFFICGRIRIQLLSDGIKMLGKNVEQQSWKKKVVILPGVCQVAELCTMIWEI